MILVIPVAKLTNIQKENQMVSMEILGYLYGKEKKGKSQTKFQCENFLKLLSNNVFY